jgi:hypothetical protein
LDDVGTCQGFPYVIGAGRPAPGCDNSVTKPRQSRDKAVTDPRQTICRVNQWGKHRWAISFKDKISKSQYFQVLRCRYCAVFVLAQFERTVLPSGRVTVTERVEAIEPGAADGLKLREGYVGPVAEEAAETR